jgi:hypothetical protein
VDGELRGRTHPSQFTFGKSISCEDKIFQVVQPQPISERPRRDTVSGAVLFLLAGKNRLFISLQLVQLGHDFLALGFDIILASIAADVKRAALGRNLERLTH